jgi:magnesium-transporting ATPase (P-type)
MKISPSNILPKLFSPALTKQGANIHVSPVLVESSMSSEESLLVRFGTSLSGLTSVQAARLIEQYGPNAIASEQQHSWQKLIRNAVLNPLVILLAVIGVVAFLTQDYDTAAIISLMYRNIVRTLLPPSSGR